MLYFNKTVIYAIKALIAIRERGVLSDEPVPCRWIAEQNNLPERFMLQIMRKLVVARILYGVRGATGGYRLANQDPTLRQIVEAIDKRPFDLLKEADGPLLVRLRQVNLDITYALDNTSLADLIDPAWGQHLKEAKANVAGSTV
jgi:Rrf2 family protein